MAWVRWDDEFDDDEDLAFLTTDAVCLQLCACTWSARHLTDGLIPSGQVRRLMGWSDEAVRLLVERKWWVPVDGGYMVRSFLKFNPSRAQVQADREGAKRRKSEWAERQKAEQNRVGNTVPNAELESAGNAVTNALENAVPNALENGRHPVSRIPDNNPDIPIPEGACAPATSAECDFVQHEELGKFPPSHSAVAVWFHQSGMPISDANQEAAAMIEFHGERRWLDPQGRQLFGWKSSARAWLRVWQKIKNGKATGSSVAGIIRAEGAAPKRRNSILDDVETGGAA